MAAMEAADCPFSPLPLRPKGNSRGGKGKGEGGGEAPSRPSSSSSHCLVASSSLACLLHHHTAAAAARVSEWGGAVK